VARHRSPDGRGTVSAYLPSPDARRARSEQAFGRAKPEQAFGAPSFEAASLAAARSAPRVPRGGHRRAAVKPPTVKGNTVVSATAALGAVVTGGLMSTSPSPHGAVADAAEATLPPASLAAASDALHVRTASAESTELSTVTAALPVAVPGDRSDMIDKQDVEALHKGESLAAEAAAQHAVAAKEAWVLGGHGDLDDWIEVALHKLNLPQSLCGGVRRIIMAESRGNPLAINHTDSNALAGRPSQGLMQVIPSTFRAYVLPELAGRGITDPVANITAGVRYMIANYGVGTLRNGGRADRHGNYLGY
jgi:hypothetical protein